MSAELEEEVDDKPDIKPVDNEPSIPSTRDSLLSMFKEAKEEADKPEDKPVDEIPKEEEKPTEEDKPENSKEEKPEPTNPNLKDSNEEELDDLPDGAYDTEEAQVKARKAFKQVRADNKALKEELKTLDEQLKNLKGSDEVASTATKELDELREELATYKERAAIADYRGTEEYQSKIVAPQKEAEAIIKTIAERHEGMNANQLIAAVKSGDIGVIAQNVEDLSAFEQAEVATAKNAIDKARKMESYMEEKAGDLAKSYQEKQKLAETQSMEQQVAQYKRGVDRSWKSIQESHPILDKVEGNDEWNKSLQTIAESAASSQEHTPDSIAEGEIAKRALPYYKEAFDYRTQEVQQWKAKHDEAQKLLSELRAVDPKIEAKEDPKGGKQEDTTDRPLKEVMMAGLRNSGLQ